MTADTHPSRAAAISAGDKRIARRVFAQLGNGCVRSMVRLAGYTNRVYAVETARGRFCLRIPGAGTERLIDRTREEANARIAAAAGVAPAVLYFDAAGVMVTPLLEAEPLSSRRFAEDRGALARAAEALRRLHQGAADFVGSFDAFGTTERYAAELRQAGDPDHPRLKQAVAQAAPLRQALAASPADLRPCHCDPTGPNLLDDGERVWLIDWEYSGMNDPVWDLAYLAIEGGLKPRQDRELLAAYFGRPAAPGEEARLEGQKAACQLLSAAWALVQSSGGNAAADFRSYAGRTLESFQARLASAAFARALDVLRQG